MVFSFEGWRGMEELLVLIWERADMEDMERRREEFLNGEGELRLEDLAVLVVNSVR